MKRPRPHLLFRRTRTVALAGLLAVAGAAVGGCASSGNASQGESKSGSAGASSSGTDKFCGRRSDVDCDPRNRDGHCTTK
jgi:hypothetical protein